MADLCGQASASGSGVGKEKAVVEEGGVELMIGQLNLVADTSEKVVFSDSNEEDDSSPTLWYVLGRVLSPAVTHVQTVQLAMRPAWGNPRGLQLRLIDDNLFVADFLTKMDRDRARDGTPWMVGKHAVLLQDYDGDLRPSDIRFDNMSIWVRSLNMQLDWMNDRKGKKIAKMLGPVEKMGVDDRGNVVGSFLQARVAIPIEEPLHRWVIVDLGKDKDGKPKGEVKIYLQLENLPYFCFCCGDIGHSNIESLNPADRDYNGLYPYDKSLRDPDDRCKKFQSFSQADQRAGFAAISTMVTAASMPDEQTQDTRRGFLKPPKREARGQEQGCACS